MRMMPLFLLLHLFPSLYFLNASSIAKPHALGQVAADLNSYQIDIAITSETHIMSKHRVSNIQIPGYCLLDMVRHMKTLLGLDVAR